MDIEYIAVISDDSVTTSQSHKMMFLKKWQWLTFSKNYSFICRKLCMMSCQYITHQRLGTFITL